MAVTATINTLAVNTLGVITASAATSSVANATEVFTITPTVRDQDVLLTINNVAADQGTVTYSIAAGGLWAAGAVSTGSVAQGVSSGIILEGAKYKSSTGTYVITFTPATGKRLLTDHAMTMQVIQLP